MMTAAAVVVVCCFLLLGILGLDNADKPDTKGFISIDCGLDESTQSSSYTDPVTRLTYTSESEFIDNGIGTSYKISDATNLAFPYPRYLQTLRSFPSGVRNCYTLQPYQRGLRYLIRARFLYGNYDQRNELPQFDLYLGVSWWTTIYISNASLIYWPEVLTFASSEYIWVCLVDTGSGTPFISSLEMRPLKNGMYPSANTSTLVRRLRQDLGSPETSFVRYPDDPYDRFWLGTEAGSGQIDISTTDPVDNLPKDAYNVPAAVMETAITAANNGTKFTLSWTPEASDKGSFFHVFMHFAELQNINTSRTFMVNLNGKELWSDPWAPTYLTSGHFYTDEPGSLDSFEFEFKFISDSNNGTSPLLAPIINAWEIYRVMDPDDLATDVGDVLTIMDIKKNYKVKKNWMVDPCFPENYTWDGLNCSKNISGTLKITALNLSSSGLVGEISDSFSKLKEIISLDLSNNNLTGSIPDSLADLPSIQFINLTGNQLSGSIPPALHAKSESGHLILSVQGNPNLCFLGSSCEKEKKKTIIPIILIPVVVSILLLLGVVFCVWAIRKRKKGISVSKQKKGYSRELSKHDIALPNENRRFTYKELEKITNKFEQCIGEGGSAKVYLGNLETCNQVAVKMLGHASPHGTKQFLAEAQLLTKVHHWHLVSLVGYCTDDKHLALVYEYMPQGSLQEHLSGGASNARSLNWIERLQIALGAAKGLEYLHKGCRPPIIHRDVKTQNILLSEKLEAKVADFGLSKAFKNDYDTHVTTEIICGTKGYLDPEHHNFGQLNEKSDVYSFGVVLLELITGQPAILTNVDNMHISQWVEQRLARGDIGDIVDPRMQGEYDVNSIWKVAELAMNSIEKNSSKRDTMAEIIEQLKEALELEASYGRVHHIYKETPSMNYTPESGSEIIYMDTTSMAGPSAR